MLFPMRKKTIDLLIVTGLTNPIPMPQEALAKKKWLEEMVANVLGKVDPEGSGKILWIKQG